LSFILLKQLQLVALVNYYPEVGFDPANFRVTRHPGALNVHIELWQSVIRVDLVSTKGASKHGSA
jgi:hypothetical protein